MTRITRATTARDLADFLAAARLAVVAWNRDGQVAAAPAAFRFANGRYVIGVAPGTLTEHAEVVALIDEGPMYFDLRGVRVRGRIAVSDDARGGALDWFVVEPEREVAWHYGRLRER
jgi:hypothetical protein